MHVPMFCVEGFLQSPKNKDEDAVSFTNEAWGIDRKSAGSMVMFGFLFLHQNPTVVKTILSFSPFTLSHGTYADSRNDDCL